MSIRTFCPVALGMWLCVSGTGRGQEGPAFPTVSAVPTPEQAPRGVANQNTFETVPPALANQRVAEAIAAALRQAAQLRRYRIDIAFADGVAELSGQVADQGQHDEVLRLVQSVPGVARVRDLIVVPNGVVVPAQASVIAPAPIQPVEVGPPPAKVDAAPHPDAKIQEPLSIVPVMPPGPMAQGHMPNPTYQPPPMPPYAWPTYAPYNNYSRVAYPTLYPYEAWPFIGPMYPFPKVPPGWRAVTLRWQDGHWWYGREATGHDWWRIRYW